MMFFVTRGHFGRFIVARAEAHGARGGVAPAEGLGGGVKSFVLFVMAVVVDLFALEFLVGADTSRTWAGMVVPPPGGGDVGDGAERQE